MLGRTNFSVVFGAILLLTTAGCGRVTLAEPDAAILPDAAPTELIVTVPERCARTGWGVAYVDIFDIRSDQTALEHHGFAAIVNTSYQDVLVAEVVSETSRTAGNELKVQFHGGQGGGVVRPGSAFGELNLSAANKLESAGLVTEPTSGAPLLSWTVEPPPEETGATFKVRLTSPTLPGRASLLVTMFAEFGTRAEHLRPVGARFVCAELL